MGAKDPRWKTSKLDCIRTREGALSIIQASLVMVDISLNNAVAKASISCWEFQSRSMSDESPLFLDLGLDLPLLDGAIGSYSQEIEGDKMTVNVTFHALEGS